MAKTQRTSSEPTQSGSTPPTTEPASSGEGHGPAPEDESSPAEARKPILTPDPRGIMSISLGDTPGSPRMRLLRSHKYKQIQIEFGEKPDDKYLETLKADGWIDRTQREGIWTKQVEEGQWKPVAEAERLFKEIANGIRADKGLEPVMAGLSAA